MGDVQEISSGGQHNGNNDDDGTGEPPLKQPRLDIDDNNDTECEPVQPKSLTTIYFDCLERIFDFLELKDMLNIAHTCKRLQTAAVAKFSYDYRNRNINFELSNYERIELVRNDISVSGLKYCLPFLRCFGAKCSSVTISTNRSAPSAHHDHLDQYITKYCSSTLKSIRFIQKQSFKSENFSKPFPNVRNVYIGHMDLGQSLPLIGNIFPNAHMMVLYGVSIDEEYTTVAMSQLVDLAINDYRNYSINGVLNLLHANPQLQAIRMQAFSKLYRLMTLTTIKNMLAENAAIAKVSLSSRFDVPVTAFELRRFAVERSNMVELDVGRYVIDVDDALVFISSMASLKKFVFKVKNEMAYESLVDQLDHEWKCHRTFLAHEPKYSFNNSVCLTR